MAKVTTIIHSEYVCECLHRMRTMLKTYDFSGLKAEIERVQFHVDTMEKGLGRRYQVNSILENKDITDAEKLERIRELFPKGEYDDD